MSSLTVGGRALITLFATERGLQATDVGVEAAATQLNLAYKSVANALSGFAAFTAIPGLGAVTPIGQVSSAAATTAPVNAAEVSWVSSNPSVASIANGIVGGIAVGQATITGTYQGKSANVGVRVVVPGDTIPRSPVGDGSFRNGVPAGIQGLTVYEPSGRVTYRSFSVMPIRRIVPSWTLPGHLELPRHR
jgi:LysM repeat protein